jgi:hypothetical protein
MREQMQAITLQEFNTYPLGNYPRSSLGITTEMLWFKHESMLGIVLLDNVDNDWSFVALSRHDDGKYYAFDVGVSKPDTKAAVAALKTVLEAS